MPRGGSKPGERRGGRVHGTPNKLSIGRAKAAVVAAEGTRRCGFTKDRVRYNELKGPFLAEVKARFDSGAESPPAR